MHINLPELKIVPTKTLVLHEGFDIKRLNKVLSAIKKDKIIKNPPIVAKIKPNQYVVLDGANRVTAIKQLNISHLIVQVIDYLSKDIKLKTWNHFVYNLGNDEYDRIIRLAKQSGLCFVTNKKIKIKNTSRKNITTLLRFINTLFALYKNKDFYRVLDNNPPISINKNINKELLIIYPEFKPLNIIKITKKKLKMPAGITRHIINNRVIGVNIPLDCLKSRTTVREKNIYLQKLIQKKLYNNEVRYYNEPIISLDD